MLFDQNVEHATNIARSKLPNKPAAWQLDECHQTASVHMYRIVILFMHSSAEAVHMHRRGLKEKK